MIRAVDLCVAVDAASHHDALVGEPAVGQIVPHQQVIRVAEAARLIVAAVAQERRRGHEQLIVIRAVGVVAIQAALHDGGMLPEERPSLLCVTCRAEKVDTIPSQQWLGGRAMRVVAIAARDLALE
jgi:hypothetical protein